MSDELEQGAAQGATTEVTGDMLEQLLKVASERAAKEEAEQALKKGFVSREQINIALTQLSTDLRTQLSEEISGSLSDLVEKAVKAAITVDDKGAVRKGTLLGGVSLDEREADPVAYIIKKGKELGPESYDDTDKRIMWAVTHKALSMGMIEDQGEDED